MCKDWYEPNINAQRERSRAFAAESRLTALESDLAVAEGLLRHLLEGWATHPECECADCIEYRKITAFLSRNSAEKKEGEDAPKSTRSD